jgi:HK97 family phage portal protein
MNPIFAPLRFALARMLVKSAGFSIVPPWVSTSILMPTFRSLTEEAYQKNAVFLACVEALAFGFMEPPLLAWDGKDSTAQPLADHPARKLIENPNPQMSESDFSVMVMTYIAISGNCYLYKARNSRGAPVELWPYHDGQIRPLPGGGSWVRGYEFIHANREPEFIDAADIIHLKWPTPDPKQPWMAQPPLRAAAAEVDSDNEASRYLRALLQNDAVPRTVVTLPPGGKMSNDEKHRFRANWQALYGGDNSGGVAVLENGATIARLGLDLQQLAFEAMHRVPEKRICAVMRTPPVIAGLGDDPTYANSDAAYYRWTRSTLVPLWTLVGAAMQKGLSKDFGGVVLGYDTSQVQALQEDTTDLWGRVLNAWDKGILEDKNEARGLLNLPRMQPTTDDALATTSKEAAPILGYHIETGVVSHNEARAQLGLPPEDETMDARLRKLQSILATAQAAVNVGLPLETALTLVGMTPLPPLPEPPALTDGAKARKATGRQTAEELRRIRTRSAATLERQLDAFFAKLAGLVVGRAEGGTTEADRLLRTDDFDDLERATQDRITEMLRRSWPLWNETLGVGLSFDLDDPAVARALADSATRVKGISDYTREKIREVLIYGAEQDWSTDQIVRGDDGRPGLRAVVDETYKGRARNIARTETATAQNVAAHARFEAAGITHVEVLDGGGDDSDDECNRLNGTRQTLAWAQANPIGHPQCVRAFAPITTE